MNTKELMKRADITKIDERIYLSGAIQDYNLLKELNISAVLNLRAEQHDDIYELTNRGIAYYFVPVSDYLAPRMDQIKACINIIDHSFKILIHCSVGRGRSAMIVAAWLMKENGYINIEECIDFIVEKRPNVALTSAQYDKLCTFVKKECQK